MRILLIEDNQDMALTIDSLLKSAHMIVDHGETGEEGLELAKLYEYDLMIQNLDLADIDGFDFIRKLRSYKITIPILVLSSRSAVEVRVKAFTSGADDFLVKPFDGGELMARVHAIIRRAKGHAQSILKTGKLEVNLDSRLVSIDSEILHLTAKEYAILELLSLRKGQTLSKEQFLNHLYGGIDEPEQKIIDVFICKLRKKLLAVATNDCTIETVWGRGYVLRASERANMPITIVNQMDQPAA